MKMLKLLVIITLSIVFVLLLNTTCKPQIIHFVKTESVVKRLIHRLRINTKYFIGNSSILERYKFNDVFAYSDLDIIEWFLIHGRICDYMVISLDDLIIVNQMDIINDMRKEKKGCVGIMEDGRIVENSSLILSYRVVRDYYRVNKGVEVIDFNWFVPSCSHIEHLRYFYSPKSNHRYSHQFIADAFIISGLKDDLLSTILLYNVLT